MGFSTSVENGATVLRIAGDLDVVALSELRPAVNGIAEGQPARVVVDLSALRLIDSSGVGAIVSLYKAVRLLRLDRLLSDPDNLAPWPR